METSKIFSLILFAVLVSWGIYFVIKMKKKENQDLKLRQKKLKEIKEKEQNYRENLENNNPDEYQKLLEDEKKINDKKILKNKLYSKVRIGVIIFAIPHLLAEVVFSELGQPVYGPAFNLGISLIFLKNQIFKKNKTYDNPILQGMIISFNVFVIRFVLGFLIAFYQA